MWSADIDLLVLKMFRYFFIFAVFLVSGKANTDSPINKMIRLAFGVSKSAYLPVGEGRYVQSSSIIGPKRAELTQSHDRRNEEVVCSIRGWVAQSYEKDETEIVLFTNIEQKLAVFGFRGTGTNKFERLAEKTLK